MVKQNSSNPFATNKKQRQSMTELDTTNLGSRVNLEPYKKLMQGSRGLQM